MKNGLPIRIMEGDNGDSAMTGGYACYCLFSSTIAHRVYTGYTNNFARRLHEHNSTSKGARHTHEGRPFFPLIIVSGFTKRKDALRFEKCMKKRRSSIYKRGIMGRIATLLHNLRNKEWRNKKLRVLCMFDKSKLRNVCKNTDTCIKSEFIFRKFKR